jgi:N-acetyl-anhydromuramyl-L-alanine amidase AmpD
MGQQNDFIQKIAPLVQKIAPDFGIKCNSAVIAQACLESAYGTSNKAKHHNYFGLKYRAGRLTCNSGTFVDGSSEQREDGSHYNITDSWYEFDSMENGVKGYFQFINIPNYANVKGVTDPKTYLTNIRADGYATSLDYVKNVMAVVNNWNLTQYDNPQPSGQESGKVSIKINQNTGFKGYNVTVGREKPKYIVVHYVGATSTAANNVAYFNGGNRSASADFFVDEKGIWQYNPNIEGQYSWHCGGGRQSSEGGSFFGICKNVNSIGIEMCCYEVGSVFAFKEETVENTATLVKYLMQKYGIPVANVIRHFDVTGKYCPDVPGWIPPTGSDIKWTLFKSKLTGAAPQQEEELSDGTSKPASSTTTTTGGTYMFSVDTIKQGSQGKSVTLMQRLLRARGYKGKDGKALTLDGSAGTNTIHALKNYQKKAKLTQDGICGQATWKSLLGL